MAPVEAGPEGDPSRRTTRRHFLLNAGEVRQGWPEEVFNKQGSGVHALLTPEAATEAIAYLVANPVQAGAVRVHERSRRGAVETEARASLEELGGCGCAMIDATEYPPAINRAVSHASGCRSMRFA